MENAPRAGAFHEPRLHPAVPTRFCKAAQSAKRSVMDSHDHSLWVERLSLTNFRNYAGLTLEASPQPQVIAGANGSGKTNLLEALSLLSPGQGLRRAPFSEIPRAAGDGGFAVAARAHTLNGPADIGHRPEARRRRRRVCRFRAGGRRRGRRRWPGSAPGDASPGEGPRLAGGAHRAHRRRAAVGLRRAGGLPGNRLADAGDGRPVHRLRLANGAAFSTASSCASIPRTAPSRAASSAP